MQTKRDGQYFPVLDGVRGLAASAVMFRHMQLFGVHPVVQSYLAVDVFFALSGAVIASAYDRRLMAGMGIKTFLQRRIFRLYPMIALGVVLAWINATWGEPEGDMHGRPWLYAAFALVVLPDNPLTPMPGMNRPAWSLTYEFIANAIYASAIRKLTGKVLIGVCSVCAAILVVAAFYKGGLDTGYTLKSTLFGIGRVGFSFFLGVGIFRLYRAGQLKVPLRLRGRLGAVLTAGLLALLLLASPPKSLQPLSALLSVLVLSPMIVALGLVSELRGGWAKACLVLGACSYPLYLIHDPLAMLVAGNLIHHGHADLLPIAAAAFAPATVVLALAVHYWLDMPVTASLSRALKARTLTPDSVQFGPIGNGSAHPSPQRFSYDSQLD
jgi:peptidoglycan/LPS O-acetylase OafA/YrhL